MLHYSSKGGNRSAPLFIACGMARNPAFSGSTEWGEAHAEELRQHAVAYIDSDSNARGYLSMSGSHTLEKFINGIARDIEDPEKKITVWKRDQLKAIADAKTAEDRKDVRQRADLRIEALGSGSDWSVFLDHPGIASLDLVYGDEDGGGIYHSIYDDCYWYTHFSDTDFTYGRALSQTAGTAVIRLADADLLPYDFTGFADTIHVYLDELQKLLKAKQDEVVERNQEIEEGVFPATADPKKTFVSPRWRKSLPHSNFAPRCRTRRQPSPAAPSAISTRWRKLPANGELTLSPASLQAGRSKLCIAERKLISPDGLPRPALVPATSSMLRGPLHGLRSQNYPGVRAAIEQKKWTEANEQIVKAANALQDEAALMDSATLELEQGQ